MTREADNPMTGSDFDWMVSDHAVWGWKAPVKASHGVRRFFPSPLFLFRFHFSRFPQKRLILIVFFCRIPGGGGAHPLHPPPRSTPGKLLQDVIVVSCINLINLWNVFWFYTSIETITLCCFFKRWVAWEHSFISNVSVGRKTLIYSEIPLPAFALVYLVYFCLFIYLVILS